MKIQDGGAALKAMEASTSSSTTARPQQPVTERITVKEPSVASENNAKLNSENLQKAVEALNKAVDVTLPNRLQFRLHEATNEVQVQVVDQESEKVIKEIPPQEVLDLMAKIKEMVGWFLDERI